MEIQQFHPGGAGRWFPTVPLVRTGVPRQSPRPSWAPVSLRCGTSRHRCARTIGTVWVRRVAVGPLLAPVPFEGRVNVDEDDRKVFDGVFSHIASARRGEFNMRFGQPSLTHPLTPGYGPPYDTTSLLARQRELGAVPKDLLHQQRVEDTGAVMAHSCSQDADTGEDLPEDPDARTYLISGTDHIRAAPIKEMFPVANPVHVLDPTPVLRSLLVQLEQWVCDDAEPPPSQVPRRSDGSAVGRGDVLEIFTTGSRPDPAALLVDA